MNTKVANTIAANSPKYRRIVEPFGGGGTYALHVGHRPAKEHIVNVVDPALFGALTFAQSATAQDRARLKSADWVASPQTFDKIMAISALDGPDAFYKFLYVKKFGMNMGPDAPPAFDVLKTGEDIKALLFALPLMRALLKRCTIVNVDPFSLLAAGSDTLLILLPKSPEDVAAVQGRLAGLGGNVFFAAKVADAQAVIDAAQRLSGMVVSSLSVASIMMATFEVATNYDSKLKPVELLTKMKTGAM